MTTEFGVVLKIAHVHPASMLRLVSQGELDFVATGAFEREVPDLTYDVTYALFHRKDAVLGRATVALMDQLRQSAVERFADYISVAEPRTPQFEIVAR